MMQTNTSDMLLRVKDLSLSLDTRSGPVTVVDGISFGVDHGEIIVIVGESRSWKSVTAHSIMRLLPRPPWNLTTGQSSYRGRELFSLGTEEMRRVRGKEIAIVLQEQMTALNPFYSIGRQVEEVFATHLDLSRREARDLAIEALDEAGIPAAAERSAQYPHQLSGGLMQRAMIAMALALRPILLLADEPTTALDLTIQAQILDLIRRLRTELGMSVIFITHDLALISGMAEKTVVVYAGIIVESGRTESLFREPFHPYTKALTDVIPRLESPRSRLSTIAGSVPKPGSRPSGCPFHPRCGRTMDRCRESRPVMQNIENDRMVRCWLY